jgi:hypothetical protein
MLLCFRCAPETKEQLAALVSSGAYRDHGDAIAAAIANLFLMEEEFASKGEMVIDAAPGSPNNGNSRPSISQKTSAPRQTTRKKQSLKRKQKPVEHGVSTSATTVATVAQEAREAPKKETSEVPSIFRRDALPVAEPKGLADLSADIWHQGQDVPLDRWMLGQFNRLLPAKVNARALIHLFVERNGGLGIGEAANLVAKEALNLRDYLAAIDEREKVSRDDALATAFPQRKKDEDKALTRYANQFVVYQNSRGELSGLMIDLKLINVGIQRRERHVVPTHIAWEFAKLENPVLDATCDGMVQKFSDQEKAFLLAHILHSVPVESFAYRVILETVMNGDSTPEKIDRALQEKFVSKERAEKLSQSFLTSQRSGAISRMADLGLIERQRDGVRVFYSVTEAGRGFLLQYNGGQ